VCCRKKFEQRERDAEEFYKSDSGDSDTNMCALDTIIDFNEPGTNGGPNVTVCSADVCCTDAVFASAPHTTYDSNSVSDTVVSSSDASILNRDTNICNSEIHIADISETMKFGISASNSEMTIPDSHARVHVHGRSATVCTQESDADVHVPCSETKSLSNILIVDDNHKVESEQSPIAADSFDLCLHYSESQDVDVKGPEPVTLSALHDEESNVMEAGNTEELALHYSETQDSEPSLPVTGEEPQKLQKMAAWRENMPPPSPDSESVDDVAKAILQSLARRSLPGLGDITKLRPRLSATPNGIVELDEEEPGPAGVVKLVQRFMKHSAVKRPLQKKRTIEVGYVPRPLYLPTTQVGRTPHTPCLT
jgi:hypothetical protein